MATSSTKRIYLEVDVHLHQSIQKLGIKKCKALLSRSDQSEHRSLRVKYTGWVYSDAVATKDCFRC